MLQTCEIMSPLRQRQTAATPSTNNNTTTDNKNDNKDDDKKNENKKHAAVVDASDLQVFQAQQQEYALFHRSAARSLSWRTIASWLAIVFCLSAVTRMWRLDHPDEVVFDEVHFGYV